MHPKLFRAPGIVVAASAVVLAGSSMQAQTVSGVVRAQGSGTPLPQSTVVLITGDGSIVRGTITRDDGGYTLRAPTTGPYRVKVRRIGFAPDSSALLTLPPTTTVTFAPVLHPYATRLTAVRVGAASACRSTGQAAAQTVELWNDVQAALTATAIATQPDDDVRLAFMLRRFTRTVDPATLLTLRSHVHDAQSVGESYASLPAESLVSDGFIRPGHDSTLYAAPDARTLASGAFARGHCFYAVPGDSLHPAAIGLAFRPVNRSAPRDVQGVLWVDTASAELRSLDYRYTGRFPSASLGLGAPSGRVEYGKVGKGAWIVEHWLVRIPVAGKTLLSDVPPDTNAAANGVLATKARGEHFVVLYETGGNVLRTYLTRGDSLMALPASITGQVADSSTTPVGGVSGVTVALAPIVAPGAPAPHVPSTFRTVTDATGAFAFDNLAPGDYVVRWTSTRFDTLGVAMQAQAVHVESGDHAWVPSAIPPLTTIVQGICASTGAHSGVVLHGTVTDPATQAPIPGAIVSVTWRDTTVQGHTTGWTNATDSTGAYVACGIPVSDSLHFAVRAGDAHVASILRTTSRPVQRYDVASRALANSASLLVSLVDRSGRAITNGEVRVDSGAWVRGSARAPVRLDALAGGAHVLEARAPGEPVHAWSVRLHPGRAVSTTLTLSPTRLASSQAKLQPVRVVAAAQSRFEKHRATGGGHYIDQAEIAARGYPALIELLRTVPGLRVVTSQVDGGKVGEHFDIETRGATQIGTFVVPPDMKTSDAGGKPPELTPLTQNKIAWTSNRCRVELYLDGSRVYFPEDEPTSDVLRSLVSTTDIVGVEVYPSGATIPTEYGGMDSACGLIAIWTGGEKTVKPAGMGGK